ncbi:amidohydrolase family protein [Microbacterium sp. Mu-80]|uniref:Amidohydrolase family protein n=1 Tax=Microbacterium bandirmense TaxID=3122050 RepID=A0ABU8LCH4_9MICO
MIIDTHCHAWRNWPYDTQVPDPSTRGSIEALLYEMDTHGVDHSMVVCARIGGGQGGDGYANEDNNEYVLEAAAAHPDRITAWIDVDCAWRPDHHAPGAARRLHDALDQTGASGFTHYFAGDNDGWLRTNEGRDFFRVAAEAGVVASLALSSSWLPDLSEIAEEFPELPILIHHMSHPSRGEQRAQDISRIVALAEHPSIGVKISGFNYNAETYWDFPYPSSIELFRTLLKAFGTERLYWGSDFPASRDQLTYRQSIDVLRTHCAFAGEDAIARILGGNAQRFLTSTTR